MFHFVCVYTIPYNKYLVKKVEVCFSILIVFIYSKSQFIIINMYALTVYNYTTICSVVEKVSTLPVGYEGLIVLMLNCGE
jgi:hypothetical protein